MEPRIDNELLHQLYCECYQMLYQYAKHSRGIRPHVAEELVQDVFLSALEKPQKVETSENPKGWLVNAMRNKIFNYRRDRAEQVMLLDSYETLNLLSTSREMEAASAEEEVLEQENCRELHEIIQSSLSDDDLRMLRLYAYEGWSHAEIAEEMNISLAACQKRMQRSRARLKKELERRRGGENN